MQVATFTRGLTVKPSKTTITRVDYRLAVRAILVSPKRRPLINQPLKSNVTRSLSKALVWAVIQ